MLKKILTFALNLLILAVLCLGLASEVHAEPVNLANAAVANVGTASESQNVRHIVIFKYNSGTIKDEIDAVSEEFRALKDKISGIESFEYGVNNSPECLNLGFTHVFTLMFENLQARDNYLYDPEHIKFQNFLDELGILNEAFVVDYIPSID